MTVTDLEKEKLLALRRRRDHAAFQIGVATHEWRQHVRQAERIIEESQQRERALGEEILRAHGCDPAKEDFRIGDDGQILRLVGHPDGARYEEVVGS